MTPLRVMPPVLVETMFKVCVLPVVAVPLIAPTVSKPVEVSLIEMPETAELMVNAVATVLLPEEAS